MKSKVNLHYRYFLYLKKDLNNDESSVNKIDTLITKIKSENKNILSDNIESKKVLKILNLNMVNNHNINKTILKKINSVIIKI